MWASKSNFNICGGIGANIVVLERCKCVRSISLKVVDKRVDVKSIQ